MKNQLLVLVIASLSSSVSWGQNNWTEEDWQPLLNEPTRQQLIESSDHGMTAESITTKFTFPHDTTVEANGQPRQDEIFGIDISHYTNSNLRFDELNAQNVRFVYAKATQGTGSKDPKFGVFYAKMAALPAAQKVARGAYHFMTSVANESGKDQADRFVAYVNLHGGFAADDMPPSLDLEWDRACQSCPDRWANRTASAIVAEALEFLNRVEQVTGRTPMLYTARSFWRDRGIPDSAFTKFAHFKIWVADYSRTSLAKENPAVPGKGVYDLWQFSESAKLAKGLSGGVDANVFKGNEAQFDVDFFGDKLGK